MSLVHFDTVSKPPTGRVSKISQRRKLFDDFLLQHRAALKYHKSLAYERINAEMKSLSVLCVGGRGQYL